jgi:hypothetical protein
LDEAKSDHRSQAEALLSRPVWRFDRLGTPLLRFLRAILSLQQTWKDDSCQKDHGNGQAIPPKHRVDIAAQPVYKFSYGYGGVRTNSDALPAPHCVIVSDRILGSFERFEPDKLHGTC